jgi:Spy/CpxP family protein refolding chaperone
VNLKVFPLSTVNNPALPSPNRLGASILLISFMILLTPAQSVLAKDINWDSLNLTPQQETQMQNLETNWEKTHQEVSSQIDKDMQELKTLLPTGDTQRIRQLQTRISNNKMYLMNESMDTFLRKRDMLTPMQRTQLQKMLPCKNTQN